MLPIQLTIGFGSFKFGRASTVTNRTTQENIVNRVYTFKTLSVLCKCLIERIVHIHRPISL